MMILCQRTTKKGPFENGQWVEGWNVVDFFALQKQANGEMRISRVE
jgi:hypothetical protein